MLGPYIHRIDPVLVEVGGICLWWYGLSYTLGFLEIHFWLKRARPRLALSLNEVYSLSLFFIVGVLVGGRFVEVAFYEWPFYRDHLSLIPAYWLGGMSTHGLLLGAVMGTWLFCLVHQRSFLAVADELVIPGAFLLGVGRIGNFIDGQIVGSITDVCWAVKFPDAEGFRHPVVLYDGAKNLLLIPLLLWIRRSRPTSGVVLAHFIFWYGFLRIFVDLFREYPTNLFGIATGQSFNMLMSVLGVGLLAWLSRKPMTKYQGASQAADVFASSTDPLRLVFKQATLIFVLLFSLTMPSDWTQDIPHRYGKRHSGLHYSFWYPQIESAIPVSDARDAGS
jgi:phosphatidylglycerol:prolipoprotein diacylglycerol transferase